LAPDTIRIAVISDIHGNCFALDATLADIRKHLVDRIVCLGDAVQGGAQPAETIHRLRSLECPIVLGNADAWLLGDESGEAEPVAQQQLDVRSWTLSKLSSRDLDFMRSFQPTVLIELGFGGQLLCFHGSPISYNDILLPDSPNVEWQRLLGPFAPKIMAGGHTHTQQIRRVGDSLFFNPGSIGVVYDYHLPDGQYHNDPWAEYAILSQEVDRLNLDFHRVPYDVKELIKIIESSGRPHASQMVANYRFKT